MNTSKNVFFLTSDGKEFSLDENLIHDLKAEGVTIGLFTNNGLSTNIEYHEKPINTYMLSGNIEKIEKILTGYEHNFSIQRSTVTPICKK